MPTWEANIHTGWLTGIDTLVKTQHKTLSD